MQRNDVVLSVIIPTYNCEAYIEDCVESIVQDAPKALEILVVDDGSTDRTPSICDDLANRFKNVYVYHKKNEGQGIARNYALDFAKGTYVAFVDSDDLLTVGAYSEAIKLMSDGDYDLGIFRWKLIPHDCRGPIYNHSAPKLIITTPKYEEVVVDISNSNTKYKSSTWNKIFRKSIITEHNIRFQSERIVISEDYIFNYDYLPYCKRIVAANILLYNYRQSDMSYSHKYQEGYFKRLENFIQYIEENKRYPAEILDRTVLRSYSFVKTCIIQEVKYKPFKTALQEIRHICNAQNTVIIIRALDERELDFPNRIMACMIKYKLVFLLYILYRVKCRRSSDGIEGTKKQ